MCNRIFFLNCCNSCLIVNIEMNAAFRMVYGRKEANNKTIICLVADGDRHAIRFHRWPDTYKKNVFFWNLNKDYTYKSYLLLFDVYGIHQSHKVYSANVFVSFFSYEPGTLCKIEILKFCNLNIDF